MLKLNKKYYIFGSLFLTGLIFLTTSTLPLQAAKPAPVQVKLANSPAVYYLQAATHHKKAYVSALSYLSYNNKWSDVKTISAKELASYADFKLLKTGASPSVYYVKGSLRSKLNNRDDLESFGFLGEPILNVSDVDLNQYKLVSYEEIGLVNGSGTDQESEENPGDQNGTTNPDEAAPDNGEATSSPLVTGSLSIVSDPIKLVDNTFVTNTEDNLIGVFRIKANDSPASLKSLTFTFGGVYANSLLNQAVVKDQNGNIYDTNNNLRTTDRKLIVTFREPLIINSGSEKTFKIYLDFNTCACNNQTIDIELLSAADIVSNLKPDNTFPLKGTMFKLLSGESLLGQLTIQKENLTNISSFVTNGGLMGKFTLSETSGKEDVVIKKLVFRNAGSAFKNDLNDFRLINNNQVIARVSSFDGDGNITFTINYLRIPKNGSAVLTVGADLISDYNPVATVDLQAFDLVGTGQTYNLSLPIIVNNINQTITLN